MDNIFKDFSLFARDRHVPTTTLEGYSNIITNSYMNPTVIEERRFNVAADSSVSDFYNILILGNGEYYDSKIQSENSSELNTISKKLVPAINEVNTLAKNKQDKLTSGTNIKTINNQSLLGSGNINIIASSITVDTTMSDTSTNPVQNKVIKAYIDGLVGNVEA